MDKAKITMFFGKKEPEKIRPEALVQLLGSLFDKRLGQFEARARAITGDMRRARAEFGDACNAFAELDAEPYFSNIYLANINSIKSQKGQYTSVLGHIVSKMGLDVDDGLNPYDRYKLLLSSVGAITNEVLQANAKFKTVLYCYSKHLETLTRSFSAIEKSREALRREIDSRSKEASEYAALKERISMLDLKAGELKGLDQSLNALKDILSSRDKNAIAADEAKLSESLARMRTELSSTSGEIAKLSERISLLTLPLERPSKKLDHVSVRRRQLHPFMVDPIGRIGDENDYKNFTVLIYELKEAVEKGTVDTKNKEETLSLIRTLLGADTYGYVSAFRLLQHKRSNIEDEIRALGGVLDGIRKNKDDSAKAIQEMEVIENRMKEATASIASTKSVIEAMFLDYYHKPISITL